MSEPAKTWDAEYAPTMDCVVVRDPDGIQCDAFRCVGLLRAKDATIERLRSRITDYQDACSQRDEIINGQADEIERLRRKIKTHENTIEWYQALDATPTPAKGESGE